jgi:hypothetical protein
VRLYLKTEAKLASEKTRFKISDNGKNPKLGMVRQ